MRHFFIKVKGLALVQALFFMMFIMAIISFSMMITMQRNTKLSGERLAVDAYPLVSQFVSYAQNKVTSAAPVYGSDYFSNYPISSHYCEQLQKDELVSSNVNCYTDSSSWTSNIVFTVS